MVYCRYCGTQNRGGNSRCVSCGKPLPLIENEPQQRPNSFLKDNRNMGINNSRINPIPHDSIKNRYLKGNQNNQSNQSSQYHQNNQNYPNPSDQQIYQQHQSLHDQQYQRNYQNQENYQNYQKNQGYFNNLHDYEGDQKYSQNYMGEPKKVSKTAIEWDVVIATALMVIILAAILQRIFPFFAIFISLFVGLIYILIATKSKLSLIKSIPLTLLVILSISAYFGL